MKSLLSLAATCVLLLFLPPDYTRAVTAPPANDKPWDLKKLQGDIANLDRANAEIDKKKEAEVKGAEAAKEKQNKIVEQAVPVRDELEKTWYPKQREDNRDVDNFNSRCKGEVPPETARSCASEKAQKDPISTNIRENVKTREDQLKAFGGQWDSLQGEIAGHQKQYEVLQAKKLDLQKQLEELKKQLEAAQKCEAVYDKTAELKSKGRKIPAMLEALHNCYSQSWDGAAERPSLGDNPRRPFVATPNADAGTVDATGVEKMSDAERQKELSKPGVQRPRPRRATSPRPER